MILPLLLVALTFEAAPTRSLAQTSEANVTLPNGAVVRGFIPWGNGTRVFLGMHRFFSTVNPSLPSDNAFP